MRDGALSPMGGTGGIVEIDETFFGIKEGETKARGSAHKNAILTLVERGGVARSFHVERVSKDAVIPIVQDNIAKDSHVMTDESTVYGGGLGSTSTSTVRLTTAGRNTPTLTAALAFSISTNTVEGFYSIFKRGMVGVYQHCSEQHLHRYLAEFDFRYSNRIAVDVDDNQAEIALQGVKGKRLTYETTAQREESEPKELGELGKWWLRYLAGSALLRLRSI